MNTPTMIRTTLTLLTLTTGLSCLPLGLRLLHLLDA